MTNPKIPEAYRNHLDHDAKLELIQCKECKTIPGHFAEVKLDNSGYNFLSLSCCSSDGTWFVCCICEVRFARRIKAQKHSQSKKHARLVLSAVECSKKKDADQTENDDGADFRVAFGDDDNEARFCPVASTTDDDTFSVATDSIIQNCNVDTDIQMHDHHEFAIGAMTDNSAINADSPAAAFLSGGRQTDVPSNNCCEFLPPSLPPRQRWIADGLKDTGKASTLQVFNALSCSPNMQRFWQAEHTCPGGGLMYLVGRSVARSHFVGAADLPGFQEAKWQFQCFMQYISLNECQRKWHAEIIQQVTSCANGNSLIKKTRIPNAQELKRFYKSDCQHCLWETLPIPKVHNIDGIAYVNPLDICTFAFACGLSFDDIPVTRHTVPGDGTGKQYHISDSRTIRNWVESLQAAQDANGDYFLVISWCTDWRDAFGPNRTKNNRKSVTVWTWSVAPTKDAVNSGDNTFPMALGQKKNSSWEKVEHRVRLDTAGLGNPNKPLLLYHGGLKKMVRVFIKRINSSHDKPERADITGTIACTSNVHRSFGKLMPVVPPICNTKKVLAALDEARPHSNMLDWGWSDGMVEMRKDDRVANGAKLPSCFFCRAKRLCHLLGSLPGTNYGVGDLTANLEQCRTCADWALDASTAGILAFPVPAKYPRTYDNNCPVEAPTGRSTAPDTFLKETNPSTGKTTEYLPHIDVQFGNLVKAVKFAFYHCMSGNAELKWNKSQLESYLNSNGIPLKYANQVWEAVQKVIKDGQEGNVNFDDNEGIGTFRFPAAWIDPNLQVSDFIETLMHEMCLGLGESNFELCSIWNKTRKRDTAFKRNAQALLLDVKKFGLNWLRPYHFTASEDPTKGGFGTGPWVSENWMAWMRLSKIVYLHCGVKSKPSDDITGNGDIFRVIVAFTALCARAFSHSGVDDEDIKEFQLLVKEFLSCVKELDIQSRFKEMSEKRKPNAAGPSESTVNEAVNVKNMQNAGAGNKSEPAAKTGRSKTKKGSATSKTKKGSATSSKKKRKRTDDDDEDYVDNNKTTFPVQRKRATTKKARKKPKNENKKEETVGGSDAWWMKSNYMSLPNLVTMMELFGALINFWDGGGKCEKFIQKVKPLITQGVHEYESFFIVIMEKLYKNRVIDIFKDMYSLFGTCLAEEVDERRRVFIGPDGELVTDDDDSMMAEIVSSGWTEREGQDFSPIEDKHMAKLKAFYVYRSKAAVDSAIEDMKPISGILVWAGTGDDPSKLDFYVIYRQQQSYGWYKIVFNDSKGVSRGGLWYAPLAKEVATAATPQDFKSIQELAKMSTVAIPMLYGIGQNKEDSNKYAVITNWWKERKANGRYSMPDLDPSLYVREDKYQMILERLNPNAI